MDGWMDRWMDGWMDGRIGSNIFDEIKSCSHGLFREQHDESVNTYVK
jgi:hypothetical protein